MKREKRQMNNGGKKLLNSIKPWGLYIRALIKWMLVAVITGVFSGLLGSVFHICVDKATQLRDAQPWLLLTLPAAGLLIAALYKLTRAEGLSTNSIIDEVQTGQGLSLGLIPAIFFSTVVTHLCGGSAGREGAALQLGGTVGFHTGKLLRLDDRDLRIATMVGMAAFFTALFGTPLTATVFSMSVISVGFLYHAAMLPCLTASLTAYGVSLFLGVEPTRFSITVPELAPAMLLKVAVLATLCAFLSVLFCMTIHGFEAGMRKLFKNPWLRAVFGGVLVIVLTFLCGTRDYNGAGMQLITAAVEQGRAAPLAFLLKLLFTAITLSAGFKGGEVVPAFFVGATFACVIGPLLGIPAGFAAAIGLVAVFCGAVNCPLSSVFLSVELFGAAGMLYFALACALSFIFSGYSGLYSSQRIVYDKLKARYINVQTNTYRTGESAPGQD